jgi:putative membrane protein
MVTFEPGPVILLVALGGLYLRASRLLAGRGRPVPRWQQISWWSGLLLIAIALLSPLDRLAGQMLTAHMGQHILLGDLAAPLLVAGLRTPMLQWFLPRPVLVPLARRPSLRRVGSAVRNPVIALVLYAISLYGWHFAATFTAALRHPVVHVAQHESFLVFNMIVWWVVLEPSKARMPGDLWKVGHIFAARMLSMFLGVGLVFSHEAWYRSFYGNRPRAYGLTPLTDQQLAGGMMMSLDIIIMFFALCLFFWRAASDEDRANAAVATAPGAGGLVATGGLGLGKE